MNEVILTVLFAMAMGYVEAAVVVYLRALYYPDGFDIPMQVGFPYIRFTRIPQFEGRIPPPILRIEVGREVATIVMLSALALLAGGTAVEKVAVFLLAFGVWDIFYYVFLKVLLGWPSSLRTLDVLFLIPVPWVGPVWLPLSIAMAMAVAGASILLGAA